MINCETGENECPQQGVACSKKKRKNNLNQYKIKYAHTTASVSQGVATTIYLALPRWEKLMSNAYTFMAKSQRQVAGGSCPASYPASTWASSFYWYRGVFNLCAAYVAIRQRQTFQVLTHGAWNMKHWLLQFWARKRKTKPRYPDSTGLGVAKNLIKLLVGEWQHYNYYCLLFAHILATIPPSGQMQLTAINKLAQWVAKLLLLFLGNRYMGSEFMGLWGFYEIKLSLAHVFYLIDTIYFNLKSLWDIKANL